MGVPGCERDMTPHYSGLGVCDYVCMYVCVYVGIGGRGFRDARCLMNSTETHKHTHEPPGQHVCSHTDLLHDS